jgi:hypothetical protein
VKIVPASFTNSQYEQGKKGGMEDFYEILRLDDAITSLGMTQDEQVVFMGIIGFDSNTAWTLDGIARLYSHQRLCKILRLPVKRYTDWLVTLPLSTCDRVMWS